MRFIVLFLLVPLLQNCKATKDTDTDILFPIIQPSLFPNVPPYIKFYQFTNSTLSSLVPKTFDCCCLQCEPNSKLGILLKSLKFGRSNPVVNQIIHQAGMQLIPPLDNPYTWFGMVNAGIRKRQTEFTIESILRQPFQKYSIMPGSENLAFKKPHHFHTQRAIEKHGVSEFNFMFETYALPEEYDKFKTAAKQAGNKTKWILKPSNGYYSKGVKLYEDWRYVSRRNKDSIVQKYCPISEQYKIRAENALWRVEFRQSIVVTRFNPLVIYRYKNSIPKAYNNAREQMNRFTPHDGQSPKHGLFLKRRDRLLEHEHVYEQLKKDQCDVDMLDQAIDDIIIKTLMSTEDAIAEKSYHTLFNYYNAFQLWTIDIILDKNCIPFLLEANRYGAIAVYSNVTRTRTVKLQVVDMLNLVGYQFPPYISNDSISAIRDNLIEAGYKSKIDEAITFDERLYTFEESYKEKQKRKKFRRISERDEYLEPIMEELLPGDLRYLIQAEDELFRSRNFRRIFPTNSTFKYIAHVESDDYFYKLQDAWETKYSGTRRNEGIAKLKWHAELKHHLSTTQRSMQRSKDMTENII